MQFLTKWLSSALGLALTVSIAAAADTVSLGTVKSIDANGKKFVLTDAKNADWTFKIGDNMVVNRGGKVTKNDLKAGDPINVSYDKGTLTWTAHYVLVQEGTTKDCKLVDGSIKSYDADKKELTFTSENKEDSVFAVGSAKLHINGEDAKFSSVAIGDHALLIVEVVDGKATLNLAIIQHAK